MNQPSSNRAVFAVAVAMAIVGFNTTAIGVATRGIADDLGASFGQLEWIVGAYLLTAAAFALSGGRLGDNFGRSHTFVGGLVLFGAGSVVAATAAVPTSLITGRAVQGIGAALIMPCSIEVLAAYAPHGDPRPGFRTRSISYASAFGAGPLIGGLLTDGISWQAVFWFEVVGVLLAAALAVPLLPARSTLPKRPTHDFVGALLVGLVVFLVVLSASRMRTWGWWSTRSIAAAILIVVLATLAVQVEKRASHPLLHSDLLRDRVILGANVASLGASIGMIGLIYFFNLFAQSTVVFASTAVSVALTLVPFTLSIIGFSALASWLTSRYGFGGPVVVGLGIAIAGFWLLSSVSDAATQIEVLVPLVVCGIGAGIANAGLTSPAVLIEPEGRLDEAAGLISMTRFLGSAMAIAVGSATYLAVGLAGNPSALALPGITPEEALVGASKYEQAVAMLEQDLAGPYMAATRAATAEAFAVTMRVTALTLTVLTLLAVWLFRTARPTEAQRSTG